MITYFNPAMKVLVFSFLTLFICNVAITMTTEGHHKHEPHNHLTKNERKIRYYNLPDNWEKSPFKLQTYKLINILKNYLIFLFSIFI